MELLLFFSLLGLLAGLVWLQAPSQTVRSLVLSLYQVCAASLTRGPCPSPGCPVVFMLVDRWREGVGVDGKLVERRGTGVAE